MRIYPHRPRKFWVFTLIIITHYERIYLTHNIKFQGKIAFIHANVYSVIYIIHVYCICKPTIAPALHKILILARYDVDLSMAEIWYNDILNEPMI